MIKCSRCGKDIKVGENVVTTVFGLVDEDGDNDMSGKEFETCLECFAKITGVGRHKLN